MVQTQPEGPTINYPFVEQSVLPNLPGKVAQIFQAMYAAQQPGVARDTIALLACSITGDDPHGTP